MKYLSLFFTVFLFGCQTTSGLKIPEKDRNDSRWTTSTLTNAIIPSPNFEERKATILVIHHTNSNDDESTIRLFSSKSSVVSSHYLISRTGKITQLVDEEKRAYHAGVASWSNVQDVNSSSIGIELSNDMITPYTDEQINALIMLAKDIVARHKIRPEMVVGHLEIAPGRKVDPYINFPWEKLAEAGITMQCNKKLEEIKLPKSFSWEKALAEIGYNQTKAGKSLISFRIRYFHSSKTLETPSEDEKKYMYCLLSERKN